MQADKASLNNLSGFGQNVRRAISRLGFSRPTMLDDLPAAPPPRRQRAYVYQTELEAQSEELRRTQLALKAARARYFDLLEYTSVLYNQAPVGYLTLTHEGVIVEANLTVTKFLAITREFLLRQPIADFIFHEDRGLFHTYYGQLLSTQRPQRCELRLRRANGTFFFAQMDAISIADTLGTEDGNDDPNVRNSRPRIRITVSDISARVQLEEEERNVRNQLETTLVELRQTQAQMVKQERLAVVGQLAAGIAHDFNNILAAITLYAQLIMRAADLPSHLHTRMEVIAVQTERATQLVQQILDFSRRAVIARQTTALTPFLQHLVELLQHTLPETISVDLDVGSLRAEIDDVVDMDSSRIQQVLLNLALNARDAMPNGGALRIILARITTDSRYPAVASGSLMPGSWMQISVCDTGTGIDPEHLPHLFEPFFTTKGIGRGSGLGLAQVWGIVKQHDGEIGITSQLGVGTTFSVFLPARLEASHTLLATETEVMAYGDGELVLVVEYNNVVRTALISAVEQLGYRVLEARNGQDASALMHQEGKAIRLILSDLVMPVVNGEEFIRSVRAHGWEQPVVVLSGHPLSEDKVAQLYSYGQVSWLPKPPTLAQLACALDRALKGLSQDFGGG